MQVNLYKDPCEHWRFYDQWIPGKELAVWQPGNKWNSTAKNRLNYALKNGFIGADCPWTDWNLHRDDIFGINTSAPVRQQNPMNHAYFDYPDEKNIINTCVKHQYRLIMVKKNGVVLAYAVLHIAGEFMNISTIIGHSMFLKHGIMLPLMKVIQQVATGEEVLAVSYGEWMSGHNENGSNGLQYWKHSVGFMPLHLEVQNH